MFFVVYVAKAWNVITKSNDSDRIIAELRW